MQVRWVALNDRTLNRTSVGVTVRQNTPNIDHPALNKAGIQMQAVKTSDPLAARVSDVLTDFIDWLNGYGEKSWDFQSFFAGPVGGRAKALYYRHRLVGTAAVAPMIFCEAFLPAARRLFHHPMRFPIADAHYAMGFAFLYETSGDPSQLENAIHFLTELKESRCPKFKEYCWGYPFDWVWRGGTIKQETPLITTTPYVYEAFLQVAELLDQRSEIRDQRSDTNQNVAQRPTLNAQRSTPKEFASRQSNGRQAAAELVERNSDLRPLTSDLCAMDIAASIARHAATDIKDFPTSETASSCSYTPFDEGRVLNASAYRAFLLTSASKVFCDEDYWRIAERNLNFVLESQNPDGSWYYAMDGVRDFVDHFHTCFVMKALAKIHSLTRDTEVLEALTKGVSYYVKNLFDEDGLPKPFSKAPRLTVYKRELYDCAECINLCLLLRDRFPVLSTTLERVVGDVLESWLKRDGSFRSRKLHLGWDNVPMHRWGQAQMFRSLAFYLCEASKHRYQKSEASDQKAVAGNQMPEFIQK
jgi:hypothetical protein